MHVKNDQLEVLADAGEGEPMICVWYRNLQTHPLGIALGVVGRVAVDLEADGPGLTLSQTHDIAYIEPGRCVRVDVVRFPASWTAFAKIEAIQYRNISWDGAVPRHGRRECSYRGEQFEMTPWSDPRNLWRDRVSRLFRSMSGLPRV